MNIRTLLSSLLLTFISIFSINAQSDYETAWELLLKNDRVAAKEKFTAAARNSSTKADAFLSLSLIDWINDDNESGFANFKNAYEAMPSPYAALYAVSSLPFMNKYSNYQSPEKVAFYENVLKDAKLNGTLRATICALLAEHYRFVKNDKKANEYIAQLGVIDKWQVLGSFDNTSGSGFAKDWGAIEKTQTTDVFKNKSNADVHWYAPSAIRFDKWIDFNLYFTLNNTVNFAQSFVKSPVNQEVYLRVGTSGSLKAWLNDALVAEVVEERNCDLDLYGYKVTLQKGANRILVQIGQSEIDRSNFMLRFTDENSNPVKGLEQSAEYVEYAKAGVKGIPELLPFYPEEEIRKHIDENPQNPLYKILLAQTYLRNDKAFEATSLLKSLEETYQNSTLISNSLLEAYLRSKNNTDHTRELESIKKNDPESYPAMQLFYSEALEQERYDEALEILEQIIGVYGENSFTENAQITLASY
ncbi:MAG: hypothetical protein LBN23_02615, partial [Paludibacter sp.]|nr:hypothetical protein [Paludibacter sp.]